MQPATTISVTGLSETIRSIRGLIRSEVQEKLRKELESIAAPIVVQAQANIMAGDAIRSGALFDSMVAVGKINPNKQTVSTIVGPKKTQAGKPALSGRQRTIAKRYIYRGQSVVPAKYAHLVELGTSPHTYKMRTRRGVESFVHPGAQAKPFLGPAFQAQSGSLLDEIGLSAGRIVEQQARKETRMMARQGIADRKAYRAQVAMDRREIRAQRESAKAVREAMRQQKKHLT